MTKLQTLEVPVAGMDGTECTRSATVVPGDAHKFIREG
mgnify:FL=1